MGRTSRRKFIAGTALLAGAAVVRRASEAATPADAGAAVPMPSGPTPGPKGPITPVTVAEAEKLVEVTYTAA